MSASAPTRRALNEHQGRSRLVRGARVAIALVVGVAVACLAYWAGQATLRPPAAPGVGATVPTYVVKEGHVGRVATFTAKASWAKRSVGVVGADGLVTRVLIAPGATVSTGRQVFAIDERPVVVAIGSVPAYRDIGRGDSGADVAQLQSMLASLGYFHGVTDGEYGPATFEAVQAWHEDLGIDSGSREADGDRGGRVRRGDVIFVPRLPARVVLGPDVRVGGQIASGATALLALSDAPRFTIELASDQAELVQMDGRVVVTAGRKKWAGVIVSSSQTPEGALVLRLGTRGAASLCRAACGAVPVVRDSIYQADIVVVPRTRGPIVPAAAIRVDTSQEPYVETVDGDRIDIEIMAADAGWSVVRGVTSGDRLALFGRDAG